MFKSRLFPVLLAFWLLPGFLVSGRGALETPQEQTDVKLQLDTVILYSTGVGYFQRSGQVDGDAAVSIRFKTKDVNDLLKSLTLQDFDGGAVTSVNYSPRDPINQTLKNLSVNLTGNPGLSAILTQVRGRDLTVQVSHQGIKTGSLIGIEQKLNGQNRNITYLNLLTRGGIQSFALEDILSIKLDDPELQMDFELALALLDESRRTDQKQVTFNFQGQGKRRVQVAYLLETPVWKTTYRLVLGDEDTHFLQGWAIVENPTEEDWRDVRLALISGRPISFKMDLYRPIYLPRPTVAMQLAESVGPQTHEAERRPAPAPRVSAKSSVMEDSAPSEAFSGFAEGQSMEKEMDLSQGVQSAAQGGQAGAFFRYLIENPVTLPRQESAMVPIVNEEVQGQKIGIFNSGAHPVHPYNAVKLSNSTDLYLMAGPVTVFEAGTYAGDAQLVSLPPGAERLISFSLDLDTEVEVTSKSLPARLIDTRISKSMLILTSLYGQETVYQARCQGGPERTVLLEHPLRSGWKLIQPQLPEERTRSYYRFPLTLDPAPGKPAVVELLVAEEHRADQQIRLTQISEAQIQQYLILPEFSRSVKDALRGLLNRKNEINDAVREKKEQEQKRNQIHREQSRIRANMEHLEKDSALYRRYVGQLDEQEDLLATITRAIEQLEARERRLRQQLADYILSLEVD